MENIRELVRKHISERENIVDIALVVIENRVFGVLVIVEGGSLLRRNRIKWRDNDIPLLIASKALLLGDAYYDLLGSYIVSHMLFPLDTLYDNKLFKRIIIDIRRKTVDNEISVLASYGKVLSYALIPIEYFPMRALSIRARLYTSLQSILMEIVKSMGLNCLRDNLRETYREIIDFMVENKRLETVDRDHVKLTDAVLLEPSYKKYIPRIIEKVSPLTMSLTSFLINERVSTGKYAEMPLELLKPHLIVEMKEGVLGLGDWREILEKMYGPLRKEGKTGIVYSTEIYSTRYHKVVVKQYTSLSNIKWILASMASMLSKKFTVNSWQRQYNEYHATIILKSKGFPHRRIIIVDPISAVTVFEYIEGIPIIKLAREINERSKMAYGLTGKLMAHLHLNNIVMGDTKPDNYIFSSLKGNKPIIVPIDLEQVRETDNLEEKAWDIAMFVYFHGMGYNRVPRSHIELLKLFLNEYASIIDDRRIILEASKIKYQLPFMYIVPPHNLVWLNNTIKGTAESK